MWHCNLCNESIEDQFEVCWKCGRTKAAAQAHAPPPPAPAEAAKPVWQMDYRYFRGTLASWDQLFDEAAQFATEIGPERLVNISHSCDNSNGVITVWFWTEADASEAAE